MECRDSHVLSHHAILISPIHSLGVAVPTVSPPTARLLDDEILTLMQAVENASLSLASPTAASTAGHVSRASADGMPAYSSSSGPRTGRGLQHGHFGEIARAGGIYACQRDQSCATPMGKIGCWANLSGSFYRGAAEVPIQICPCQVTCQALGVGDRGPGLSDLEH